MLAQKNVCLKQMILALDERERTVFTVQSSQTLPNSFGSNIAPFLNWQKMGFGLCRHEVNVCHPCFRLVNENEVKQWKEQAEKMRKGL